MAEQINLSQIARVNGINRRSLRYWYKEKRYSLDDAIDRCLGTKPDVPAKRDFSTAPKPIGPYKSIREAAMDNDVDECVLARWLKKVDDWQEAVRIAKEKRRIRQSGSAKPGYMLSYKTQKIGHWQTFVMIKGKSRYDV